MMRLRDGGSMFDAILQDAGIEVVLSGPSDAQNRFDHT
jgi:2-keto-3-deoxy-L-rhamnonate aldolase RhmA